MGQRPRRWRAGVRVDDLDANNERAVQAPPPDYPSLSGQPSSHPCCWHRWFRGQAQRVAAAKLPLRALLGASDALGASPLLRWLFANGLAHRLEFAAGGVLHQFQPIAIPALTLAAASGVIALFVETLAPQGKRLEHAPRGPASLPQRRPCRLVLTLAKPTRSIKCTRVC